LLKVPAQESGRIRHKRQYVEMANRNNGVYFRTNKLKDLNSDYKDLTTAYDRKQSSLVKEVISIAGWYPFWFYAAPLSAQLMNEYIASYCPCLEGLNNTLAHLDVIVR
jgi:DNA mismatch repair protein MSH2